MTARNLLAKLGLAFGLASTAQAEAAPRSVSLANAPSAWVAYAKDATVAITGWLNDEKDPAAHMRKALTRLKPKSEPQPLALRLWVSPSGTISRIEAPSTGSADADADLRILLLGKKLKTPPKGLLQPMRLAVRLATAT